MTVRDDGRRRVYRLDARPLRTIHEWVRCDERVQAQRFARLDAVLEELVTEET